MANYFELVGKLMPFKRKDKSTVDRKTYNSGWMSTTVDFLCVAGADSVICRVQGGKWQNDEKNVIKTMSVRKKNEDGTLTESQRIDIPWTERFDPEQIAKVAGYRKFTFDHSNNDTRSQMRFARAAVQSEDWENKALKIFPFQSEDEANERIDVENAKKHQFLSEYDFAEYVAHYLENADNTLFHLNGVYDIQYNAERDRFYATYHVTSIVKANENESPHASFNNLGIYIAKDFIDDTDLKEYGKANINGWLQYYDSSAKTNGFSPIIISLYGDQKKIDYFKTKTNALDDGAIAKQNMVVDIIRQTEYKEITIDDISDEEREDIEGGLRTFEDVKKAYNNRIAGGRINELRFVSLGKDSLQETKYTIDDMIPARIKQENIEIDVFEDDEL